MLGYDTWMKHFAGAASAIGSPLSIDGRVYTVIGVMPAGFRFPLNLHDGVYIPLHTNEAQWMESRGGHFLRTVGRLKDGVTLSQAQADLAHVFAGLSKSYPETDGRAHGACATAVGLGEHHDRYARRALDAAGCGVRGACDWLRQHCGIAAGAGSEARARDGDARGHRRGQNASVAPDVYGRTVDCADRFRRGRGARGRSAQHHARVFDQGAATRGGDPPQLRGAGRVSSRGHRGQSSGDALSGLSTLRHRSQSRAQGWRKRGNGPRRTPSPCRIS